MTPPTNATILLPAATISVKNPWIVPTETRIIGEGRNATSLGVDPNFVADGTNALIEMGSPGTTISPGACGTSSVCTGITLEHLTISTNVINNTFSNHHAVYNNDAQDGSYLDDVVLTAGQTSSTGAIAVGLLIGPGASYSGPYTNIDFVGSKACPGNVTCAPTACVQIQAQIRGLHGITCTAASSTSGEPLAAIYVDSYNNTISEVHTEGYYDGVVISDCSNLLPLPGTTTVPACKVTANAISNVTVGYGAGPSWEAVHICNPASPASGTACASATGFTVRDVALTQIQSNGTSGFTTVTPITDDLTKTPFPQSGNQQFVAQYLVGAAVSVNTGVTGYTRYTTAPFLPSWGVGNAGIPSSGTCSNAGAIFTNTVGGQHPGVSDTIYVCAYNSAGNPAGLYWMPIA